MKSEKNFLTVSELQSLCEKMNLSTDGLKNELIERILGYNPDTVVCCSCNQRHTGTNNTMDSNAVEYQTTESISPCTQTDNEESESISQSTQTDNEEPESIWQSTQTDNEEQSKQISFRVKLSKLSFWKAVFATAVIGGSFVVLQTFKEEKISSKRWFFC